MKKPAAVLWALALLAGALSAREIRVCTLETSQGTIVFEMYDRVAPRTVGRISELANSGFYSGIVFHRVVPEFVVQAGDPGGTGEGGSGKNLVAEFSHLHYIRGSVGMARAEDIDSADSQFFICITDQPHLDGRYTLFGQVTEGLAVVDRIRQGDKILSMKVETVERQD